LTFDGPAIQTFLMYPLLVKVERFLRQIPLGDSTLVVAVSGGPDSVALLHAVWSLRRWPLVMAHLNHQLRGAESDADENFVRELHSGLTAETTTPVQVRVERCDIAARAKAEGENLEKTARMVRYEWLARVAQEERAGFVATGHTADDQAETVLHRLLRGAGLKGLRGIAPQRALSDQAMLIRPLLDVTRAEVLHYLSAHHLRYRHDESNFDLRFTRNRIRHKLLPRLAGRYNPEIVSVLCRLAKQADGFYRETEAQARQLLAEVERPRAAELVILDRERLGTAPRNVVREVFRLIWEREGWGMNRMDFVAWDRLAGMGFGELAALDLPGGLRGCCRGRVVQLGPVP
jgi:tRNA(Ile)-lysidine synthase